MWIEKYEISKWDWEVEVVVWGKYFLFFVSCMFFNIGYWCVVDEKYFFGLYILLFFIDVIDLLSSV